MRLRSFIFTLGCGCPARSPGRRRWHAHAPLPRPLPQGLSMPRKDLAEWLAFLRSQPFAGHSCPEDLTEACALLERAGRRFLDAVPATETASGGAPDAQGDEGGQGDDARRSPGLKTPGDSMSPTADGLRAATAEGPKSSTPGPLPLPLGTYTSIGGPSLHGWVELPAEYAAVLAACAAQVWCTPMTLHKARKGRERGKGDEPRLLVGTGPHNSGGRGYRVQGLLLSASSIPRGNVSRQGRPTPMRLNPLTTTHSDGAGGG